MKTREKPDYYEVLAVPRDAGTDAIREAYLGLSRRFHPDVSEDPEAVRRFREVSEAYDVLSQPDSRLLYDRLAYRGPGNRGFGPAHPGVGKPTADSTHVSDDELLEWIFTGRRPGRPRELVGELNIGSVEAERGTSRTVTVATSNRCVECRGRGRVASVDAPECRACGGAGRRRVSSEEGDTRIIRVEHCPACDGIGRSSSEPCAQCDGSGIVRSTRAARVFVPAGVRDGQELFVARVTGPDGVERNACVVLRVRRPRRSHSAIQFIAALALLIVLALILLVVLR